MKQTRAAMKSMVHEEGKAAFVPRAEAGPLRQTAGRKVSVALLSGCADKPYAFGLTMALAEKGATLELIGGDELDYPEFSRHTGLRFLNLRGSQNSDACLAAKAWRVLRYYCKLLRYAATARPEIFHILWNNKFQVFDRTLLMLYYRLLRKKIVFTVHNVNAGRRDAKDTWLNRLTLRTQYRLADHLFVHTEKMKSELAKEFGTRSSRITVIPFGINNAVPNTPLTRAEARRRLGFDDSRKAILFFGNITPYKGLEYLVDAFQEAQARHKDYQLIIAGRPDKREKYWNATRERLLRNLESGAVLLRAGFIPDDEVEIYFKAADVLVLPYRDIYQSGVLFLAHSFGLPVIAADVGSLREDIIEGETGFLFKPEDTHDLAKMIERYFESDLYANLNSRRQGIRELATQRHSWDVVGRTTMGVYTRLLRFAPQGGESLAMEKSALDGPPERAR